MRPLGGVRRRISSRLSRMIDWRVRQAFEDERSIILDTNKTVGEISSQLSDRISVLENSLMALQQQVDALKRDTQ
jgi:hypothetical protein